MSVEEHRRHAPRHVAVAVITVSDTRRPDTDETGALTRKLLEERGHKVAGYTLVPDDGPAIRAAVEEALAGPAEAVLLNGGTGISPRDVTIETVEPLLDRALPGFGELFRALSYREVGSAAMLSRATAGLARGKLVVAMPGSPEAVALAMERLVLPEMGHAVGEAAKGTGGAHDPLARRHRGG